MDSFNNATDFGNALDLYEKALAKKDWQAAVANMEQAIQVNPYPTFYGDLARRLEGARISLEASTVKKGFWGSVFKKKSPESAVLYP